MRGFYAHSITYMFKELLVSTMPYYLKTKARKKEEFDQLWYRRWFSSKGTWTWLFCMHGSLNTCCHCLNACIVSYCISNKSDIITNRCYTMITSQNKFMSIPQASVTSVSPQNARLKFQEWFELIKSTLHLFLCRLLECSNCVLQALYGCCLTIVMILYLWPTVTEMALQMLIPLLVGDSQWLNWVRQRSYKSKSFTEMALQMLIPLLVGDSQWLNWVRQRSYKSKSFLLIRCLDQKTNIVLCEYYLTMLLSSAAKPGTHVLENNKIIGVFTMLKLCVSKERNM